MKKIRIVLFILSIVLIQEEASELQESLPC